MAHIGFNRLEGELAQRPGVTNPGGLAYAIGAKKFGKKKMHKAAKAGKPLTDRQRMLAHYVKKHGGK